MNIAERAAVPRTKKLAECPACSSPIEGGTLFQSGDRQHGTPGSFSYSSCSSCASIFQDPQVIMDDRAGCYPNDYYTHEGPVLDTEPRRLERLREKLRGLVFGYHFGEAEGLPRLAGRMLESVPFLRRRAFFGLMDALVPPMERGCRALDIGCGSGKILRALRQAGWEAEGVDWDPRAAKTAMAYSQCVVHAGDFCELPLPAGSYSLVLMNHVFEHLDDPTAALNRVRYLLAPNGRAVLIYPNPAAVGARFFGQHWFCWEVPRHLVLVHPLESASIANRAGLEVTERRTLVRTAAGVSALSRAYQRGEVMTTAGLVLDRTDYFFLLREWLQMVFRPMTGEEVLLVLRRRQSS